MNKQTSNSILNQKVGIWDAKFFCNEAISHDDYFLSTKDLSFTQGISMGSNNFLKYIFILMQLRYQEIFIKHS